MTSKVPRLQFYMWGRRQVVEKWPLSPQVEQWYGTQTSSSPSPTGSIIAWAAASPRGPRILSFLNLSFFGLPRGTRVKGGWHSESRRGRRLEISISGKLDEYVFFQVAKVRSSAIYGIIVIAWLQGILFSWKRVQEQVLLSRLTVYILLLTWCTNLFIFNQYVTTHP